MAHIQPHRPCPVCQGRDAQLLHHQRFALPEGHPLPAQFDVVACTVCGFVYADTVGTAQDYDTYYANYSKYADQGTSTGGGGSKNDQDRLERTADDIAAYLPDGKASHIVDIGCANGGLLGALKARGFTNLCGIDPAPACVENIRNLFDIKAIHGWLGALPPIEPADLVILSHVLEHLLDPLDAITSVNAILAPAGIIYAEVPNADGYRECLFAPFQDFNTEHINHFGAATLQNLFIATDFKCLYIGTKFIESAPECPYPVVYGFFQKQPAASDAPVVKEWKHDSEFLPHIQEYIDASRKKLSSLNDVLAPYTGKPILVWGTGQLTLKMLVETQLADFEITAFINGNPVNHGKVLRGITIVAPETLKDLPPHPILIGSLLHQQAIRRRIVEELQLPNPVITLETQG